MGNLVMFLIGLGFGRALYTAIVERERDGWLRCSFFVVLGVCAIIALTSCVQVRVASTAVHGENYAASEVQAGYGEGSTMAAASDTTSTTKASRTASTVENLGSAGIGALIGWFL